MTDTIASTEMSKTIGPFPKPSFHLLGLMFVAGFVATMAFDSWGQVVSPGLGFATLSPHGLAQSFLGVLGLPNSAFSGYFFHFYLVGLIGYPLGWLFVFKPAWTTVLGTKFGWIIPSAVYGFGLWVFAIGGITSVAGLPFFLGFSGITWVALVGHVLYGIVVVAMFRVIETKGEKLSVG